MTIGFDGSRAFIKDPTGTENYSYQLLKALAKIDTVNSYIVYVRPHTVIPVIRRLTEQPESKEWPPNFKFMTIPFPRLWTQIGLAIRTFLDPIDILFVPAHTYPIFHKTGLKIIMTVHDLGAEYLPSMHQLKQRLYLNFITNFQLKSASRLIAVSKATKNDLIKKTGIKEENIKVIYEGINQPVNKIENDILINTLSHYNLQPETYFLFVGTIQPRKNLIRLIKAFKAYLNIYKDQKTKLVLVGGKGWSSKQLHQLPEDLKIQSRVIFTGRISDTSLHAFYKHAKALLFPSLFEGFGLPILEAMSYGCPVLTSNISSMPEVANDAAILVNPQKTEQILEGMIKLNDDTLRERLIQKGYNNIKRFSWLKCAEQTLETLKGVSYG